MTWLEEEGDGLESVALAFLAGCGPQYLAARWPDDEAVYRAIAEKAVEVRVEEAKALAKMIRNEIADLLG